MKRKSKARREMILQAAFNVVCDKGYYETKMDDVARKAGVAKGTVYLYFQDKPDLYVGMVKWLISQARAIVAEVAQEERTPSDKLRRVFARWVESLSSKPAAVDLVFPELREERCEISRRFHEQVLPEIRGLVDDIARLVKAGVRQGEFRSVEPRLAALSFLNAFRAALLVTSHRLGVKAAPVKALDIFFNGIRR
ncbi:TetR/AcrR family transcriptional regulator [candidate division WOR-3 bacterium]|nr:TetR/AcrR family transcriptional regulator [candidate division WOR-3 bacterium]